MKRYWLTLQRLLRPLFVRWKRLSGRTKTFIILLAVGASFYWMIANPIYHTTADGTPTKKTEPQLKSTTGSLVKGTPEYKTYLPAGKSIDAYGGWTRVSPPDRNPVYAYSDTVEGIPVSVSQQPLPKEFTAEPDVEIEEFAKAYNANQFITVNDQKVYIGTSSKGPQSVIFVKDQTLVLIKSSAKLTDDRWIEYISQLQ